mgnify:CR=1 FL=1
MLSCCASWKSGSAGTTEDVIGHTFQLRAVKIPQCGEQNFDILYRVEVPGTDAHRTGILVAAQVLVDQGGTVVDVAVENSLYGEIRATLNLCNRYDVDNFIR